MKSAFCDATMSSDPCPRDWFHLCRTETAPQLFPHTCRLLMSAGDKVVGVAGLVLSIAIFAYYTTWVLVAPFVDKSVTSFHRFFPDRWWAIAGPCVLLAAAVTFVATFMRYVSSKKR